MKALRKYLSSKSAFFQRPGVQRFLVYALLILLLSCNNEQRPDDRPDDQQSFIRTVKELRDQTDSQSPADPNRPIFIDQGVKRIKNYIIDTLKSQFSGWDARVLDNTKTDPNGSEIRITFGMSIGNFDLAETARFKSIVFRLWLSDAPPPLRERLQELEVGDHVKITGSFVSRDKRIDIDPYNEKEYKLSKNIFSNPEFRADITEFVIVED